PFIGVGIENLSNPLADFKKSLLKVRDLPVEMVLPAHGKPFTGLRTRVDQLLHHHEERASEILDALNCDPLSVYQIAGKVPWMKDLGARPFSELRLLDKRLAMMETAAHLAMLAGENKAVMIHNDNMLTWTAAGCRKRPGAGEWK
ncbi:MAG: hypothetical protein Q7T05_00165, partial [Dehalococcoidia bacterium]|nr:hypothetical protein [Dehalococcoidia bacterium]